jgi:hypothetical protein
MPLFPWSRRLRQPLGSTTDSGVRLLPSLTPQEGIALTPLKGPPVPTFRSANSIESASYLAAAALDVGEIEALLGTQFASAGWILEHRAVQEHGRETMATSAWHKPDAHRQIGALSVCQLKKPGQFWVHLNLENHSR